MPPDIETDEHLDFDKACRFCESRRTGQIADYLLNGSPLIIYAKRLL